MKLHYLDRNTDGNYMKIFNRDIDIKSKQHLKFAQKGDIKMKNKSIEIISEETNENYDVLIQRLFDWFSDDELKALAEFCVDENHN